MPNPFSANGSRDPLFSAEERRRMTEENRARAERNTPRSITDDRDDDLEARLERYRRSASNLRAATMGGEGEPSSDAWRADSPSSDGAMLNDAGYPRGARGGFSYVSGANAFAPWQNEQQAAEEDAEPVYEAEPGEIAPLPETDDAWDDYDTGRSREYTEEGGFIVVTARRFRVLLRSGLRKNPLAAIKVTFLAVAALALLGGTIYGKVMTNEIYTDISVAQAAYDDLKATNVSLRSEIDGKTTVKNVEEYAEDVLGLKQLDDSQIKYIKIQTEDEVIIAEPELSFWEKLKENFRQVWAWLSGV